MKPHYFTAFAGKTSRLGRMFTRETCLCTRFSLAESIVLAGTAASGGGMAPPTSTRISDKMKYVLGHVSPVNVHVHVMCATTEVTIYITRSDFTSHANLRTTAPNDPFLA